MLLAYAFENDIFRLIFLVYLSLGLLPLIFPGFQFDTEDADKILPGFLDSIVGMQREESRTFPYVFPETWAQEDLRGVRANFTVS